MSYESLQNKNDKKIVYLDSSSNPDDSKTAFSHLPKIVKVSFEMTARLLRRDIGEFFDKVDDVLFGMANQSDINEEQNLYYEAIREVRVQRKTIESRIIQNIQNAFMILNDSNESAKSEVFSKIKTDSLSVVQEEQVEEIITIDNSIKRAKIEFSVQFQALSLRLDKILPGKVTQKNNPLSPNLICDVFKAEAKSLDIGMPAKLLVFQLFDKHVVKNLGGLYEKINSLLIDHQILPELILPKSNNPSTSSNPKKIESQEQKNMHVSEGISEAELDELLEGASRANPRLLQELSKLQKTLLKHDVNSAKGSQSQFPRFSGKDIDQNIVGKGHTVISLVEMLFDYIFAEDTLPIEMKNLIGRLQIPMVKVALLDHSFLNNSGHSARRLLNELILTSIGWQENNAECVGDTLYNKVSEVVNRVLTEFGSSIWVFDDILYDVMLFREKERCRAAIMERRLLDSENGKAKAELGQVIVSREVEIRLSQRKMMPQLILDIADKAWRRYLFVTGLKYGFSSEEWKKGLKTLEFLIWSGNIPRNEKRRQDLIRVAPVLISRLTSGLELICYDPTTSAQWVAQLKELHRCCISNDKEGFDKFLQEKPPIESLGTFKDVRSSQSNSAVPSLESAEMTSVNQHVQQSPDTKTSSDDLVLQINQVLQFSKGTWFMLEDDDGVLVRCRFLAYIQPTDKYIFVNRYGAKVAEKSELQLAEFLKNERLKVIDDTNLFDRAFDEVVSGLRKNSHAV